MMSPENPDQSSEADVSARCCERNGAASKPRQCPAGQGWIWIREGFGLFARAPLVWVAIVIIFGAISLLVSLVPMVSLLNFPLGILFAGGLMLGCDALDRGEELSLAALFAGFSTETASLVGLGGIYLGAVVLISMILGALGWLYGAPIGLFMAQVQQGMIDPVQLQQVVLLLSGLALFGVLLLSPVLMAVWFAPALIVLQHCSVIEAATLSLQACMKNWLPFLVYGVLATLLLLMGMVPMGLGLLVVIPALTASVYAGYKDIFLPAQ